MLIYVEYSGRRGRLSLNISVDQLEFLLDIQCSVRQMATMLGCSERTVHRRLREASLSVSRSFSDISDQDLKAAVADINRDFPRHGYRLVTAHLHSRGIRVPRRRVRECLS